MILSKSDAKDFSDVDGAFERDMKTGDGGTILHFLPFEYLGAIYFENVWTDDCWQRGGRVK